jgi:hypothetical protein
MSLHGAVNSAPADSHNMSYSDQSSEYETEVQHVADILIIISLKKAVYKVSETLKLYPELIRQLL